VLWIMGSTEVQVFQRMNIRINGQLGHGQHWIKQHQKLAIETHLLLLCMEHARIERELSFIEPKAAQVINILSKK